MHAATTAYIHGAQHALQKLGFTDPEDLPGFFAKKRRLQLQRLYSLNAETGLPAGGLLEGPDHAR